MKANIGVMQLQAKESQGLPADPRSLKKDMEMILV